MYGEGTVNNWTCQKQFVKFPAEDFSLNGHLWSGKPEWEQLNPGHENNQYYMMQRIINIIKKFKSSVEINLYQLMLVTLIHGSYIREKNKLAGP